MAIKPINLTAQLPADLASEFEQQQIAQQIAQTLLASGLAGRDHRMINEGGRIQTANAGVLGDPFRAWAGRSALDDATRQQGEIGEEYQKRLTKELAQLYQGMQPEMVGAEPTDTGGAPYAPVYKQPNIPRHLSNVIGTAQVPAVRDMAQKMYERQTMDANEMLKAVAAGVDPKSLYAASRDPEKFADIRPKQHFVTHDGVYKAVDQYTPGAGAVETFKPATSSQGVDLNVSQETGKRTSVGPGGNVTPAAVVNREASKAALEQIGKEHKEIFQAGVDTLENIAQIQANLPNIPEGAFGPFAEFRNSLSKLIPLLGGKQDFSTVAMEGVISGAGKNMLQNIRLIAPVTKEDINVMQRIVGSASNSKEAFTGVVGYLADKTQRQMVDYEQRVETFTQGHPEVRSWFKDYYAPGFKSSGYPVTSKGGKGKTKAELYRYLGLDPP